MQKLDNFMTQVGHTIYTPRSYLYWSPFITGVLSLRPGSHDAHAPSSSQVIIPKANESNAIVIIDGLKGGCLLSDSFNRVMTLQVTF